jgi:uncharacterized lipoprotein YmbA
MMRRTLLFYLACLVSLAACFNLGKGTTQSSRFYLLNSISDSGLETQAVTKLKNATVGVGPLEFPEYLHRPQIATRTSNHQIQFSEFHRWGEPLGDNFSRILAENLSILLSTHRLVAFPWRSASIDYQVEVEVTRFDGSLGEQAHLEARWTIFGKEGKEALLMKKSSLRETVATENYEALVMVMSRLVERLSREIAASFKDIS